MATEREAPLSPSSTSNDGISRRRFLSGAAGVVALVGTGGLLEACAASSSSPSSTASSSIIPASTPSAAPPSAKSGGILRVGIVGGSAKDSLDAHNPVTHPDEARVIQLYEPLATRNPKFEIENVLAEEITPSADATKWTIRLRQGVEFHDGKTLGAEDLIYTLQRIIDPSAPTAGASGLSMLDPKGMKMLDERTVELTLLYPYAILDDSLAQYALGIVPAGYTPDKPVGTGPFKFKSFTPGQQSEFDRHPNYWRPGQPYADGVVLIDFPDDTARVNALLGGEVHAIDALPPGQMSVIEASGRAKVLNSETGAWLPFTMRVDRPPFDDVRVRQAFRLIVDREQMIQQALAGLGHLGNDLYAPYDQAYASQLPQRQQDLEQAKSLLKAAGRDRITVELQTAPVAAGIVEAAQVFAQQAKGAGVTVKVNKLDSGVFYGDNYLKWDFAQDFWFTRDYLPQTANGSLPEAPYNETHWADEKWISLVTEARKTTDAAKRKEILHEAQQIEYETGGYIIWGFNNQIDAYSNDIEGFEPDRSGIPLTSYTLRQVSIKS